MYKLLRGSGITVPWKDVVWFSGSIPRHSFLTWLMVLNRCPTRDRLIAWGLQTDTSCLLCSSCPETRDHLLFDCDYSFSVWTVIARRCSTIATRDWSTTLTNMQVLRGGKLARRLTFIGLQATIYAVWMERNGRLHRNTFRSADSITHGIERQIRNRISSLRESNPVNSSKLMALWFAIE